MFSVYDSGKECSFITADTCYNKVYKNSHIPNYRVFYMISFLIYKIDTIYQQNTIL